MYLHIGNSQTIREKDIIGIFDADTATISSITRKYLKKVQKEEHITAANNDIPRSFVLYKKNGVCRVCFSQLSTAALKGRVGTFGERQAADSDAKTQEAIR